jgi:hypothetical protein
VCSSAAEIQIGQDRGLAELRERDGEVCGQHAFADAALAGSYRQHDTHGAIMGSLSVLGKRETRPGGEGPPAGFTRLDPSVIMLRTSLVR